MFCLGQLTQVTWCFWKIKWGSCSRDRAYDPCCGTKNEEVALNKRTMSTRRWYRIATSEVSAR